MNRFSNALALDRDDASLGQLASAIAAAQQEIFALKGGSDEVRKDAAVSLLVVRLAHKTEAANLVRHHEAWAKAHASCEDGSALAAELPDTRRMKDGIFSQSAVNVGALSGSIGRYATEMEARGLTSDQIAADPAISLIAYQIVFLCRAERKLDLAGEDRAACVAIAAAQAATQSIPAAAPSAVAPGARTGR